MKERTLTFEPAPPNKIGDRPLWLQKWKLRRAKKRGKLLRMIRCMIGLHNPPWNEPIDEMGAICIGGTCTRCDDDVWREVVWLGNAWDFEGATRTEESETHATTIVNHNRLEAAVFRRIEELLS